MSYIAHIEHVPTGEIRATRHKGKFWRDDGTDLIYLWTSGNFACDCNRHLFFTEHDHAPSNRECGHSVYRLVKIEQKGRAPWYPDVDTLARDLNLPGSSYGWSSRVPGTVESGQSAQSCVMCGGENGEVMPGPGQVACRACTEFAIESAVGPVSLKGDTSC